MQLVKQADVEALLDSLCVGTADAVLVHSDLLRFGRPEGGVGTYLAAFDTVLGEAGTLAVPGFTFSFIKTGSYHWADTRSEDMGAFAEAVRKRPGTGRTRHPLQSVAVRGPHARALTTIQTPSAYAKNGVFQAISDLDFKVVLLGAEPKHISHSHLSEETARVPYRFDKHVSGASVLGPGEGVQHKTWSFFARDLERDVRPAGEHIIVSELLDQGDWTTAMLNGVRTYAGPVSKFVAALDQRLSNDPLWMARVSANPQRPGPSND